MNASAFQSILCVVNEVNRYAVETTFDSYYFQHIFNCVNFRCFSLNSQTNAQHNFRPILHRHHKSLSVLSVQTITPPPASFFDKKKKHKILEKAFGQFPQQIQIVVKNK